MHVIFLTQIYIQLQKKKAKKKEEERERKIEYDTIIGEEKYVMISTMHCLKFF